MTKATKIILAAAAGFVAGVLLAPKSGAETREDIKNKALDAKDYAGEKAEQAKSVARDATATLKQSATRATDEVMGFMKSTESSAEIVEEEADKLRREARTRATRVASDAKRTATQVKKDAEKKLR